MSDPVAITSAAVKEIKAILSKKGIPEDYCLRLGVSGGHGCAGVNFSLGFDKQKDADLVYKKDGLTILIHKPELMFLIGKEVDFYDGNDSRGFTFQNQADNSTTAL